jgi:hypothetical protein
VEWQLPALQEAMAVQPAQLLRFDLCLGALAERGPRCVLEVGPCTTLSRLWNRLHPDVPARSLEDFQGPEGCGGGWRGVWGVRGGCCSGADWDRSRKTATDQERSPERRLGNRPSSLTGLQFLSRPGAQAKWQLSGELGRRQNDVARIALQFQGLAELLLRKNLVLRQERAQITSTKSVSPATQ